MRLLAIITLSLAMIRCSTDAGAQDATPRVECQNIDIEFQTTVQLCPMPNGDRCYLSESGSLSCIAPAPAPEPAAESAMTAPERQYQDGDDVGPADARTDGYDGREPWNDDYEVDQSRVPRRETPG